jgi:glycosyltransferase involved in cell wall biosynthesis
MAMGKPIVASDRAILHDYVDDGVDAILVPPEDPVALRDAVELVLADPERAHSLGAAARARVERSHTSPGFAAQLAPLLRSVL